jgi:phosphotransferase system IIB component
MSSTIGQVGIAKKQKSVIKGIIRKGQKKNLVIIVGNDKYFVTITALKKVMDGTEEKTPIFGY